MSLRIFYIHPVPYSGWSFQGGEGWEVVKDNSLYLVI